MCFEMKQQIVLLKSRCTYWHFSKANFDATPICFLTSAIYEPLSLTLLSLYMIRPMISSMTFDKCVAISGKSINEILELTVLLLKSVTILRKTFHKFLWFHTYNFEKIWMYGKEKVFFSYESEKKIRISRRNESQTRLILTK